MDVLSEILTPIRISGSVLSEIECGGMWGIGMGLGVAMGFRGGIPFHYLTEGRCWLLDGNSPTLLMPGDLVVAPHWPFHALASSPSQPCTLITEVIAANGLPAWKGGTLDQPLLIKAGSAGADVRILSGVFTLTGRGAGVLIDQLPAMLHLRAQDEGLVPQLRTALDFIRQESAATRPGYLAVAARLMDLLFIQILRAAITQPTVNIGFLAGLSDEHIGRTLAAIHLNPAGPWTVAKLAAEARHSRTTFAERFKGVVGLTPMQYVNQWRISRAEHLLARPGTSIDAVRRELGFSSGFAFARAFRAQRGVSPREFRLSLQKARTASIPV
jgi:AraC family transcriptional regulator, alkane utilization regulator